MLTLKTTVAKTISQLKRLLTKPGLYCKNLIDKSANVYMDLC
jgi:hypothetical protein